ncbi:platelet-activating factor acetylhydrolase, isoform II-domain-containing protein [Crucibulum laeve]|uniref:1-alkyl-2-acetylglycerophosphocholine esterase n=1 Tax=Crucibulum laeve TaxID=68775 RepID=A0A5C3MH69_9AGAR|nr:platelet-activating factor acetylhydrolase, isoform II-domain-containing protein [Crucibulum laeve]
MLFLPSVQGRFPVGVTTFATPVRPSRPIGSLKLRAPTHASAQPALRLEEVAFTAYYPADTSSTHLIKGLDWFLRPLAESLRGFAIFLGVPSWLLWPVVYLFGALVKIPAYPNAPLLNPMDLNAFPATQPSVSSQWPLVIFSHGLGGSRTAYSQFCSRLAASGKVVLAVEHRDGTGTLSMPRLWDVDGKSTSKITYYLRDTDISWEDTTTSKEAQPLPLRAEQLAFRHHEMYLTYTTFSKFIQNDPDVEFETIDSTEIDRQSWSAADSKGKSIIQFDRDVILAGHSFGGCTVLSLLSTRPEEGYQPIPIKQAIILDPWLDPLPSPGPIPISTSDSMPAHTTDIGSSKTSLDGITINTENGSSKALSPHPRMLVINSETFTLWKDHFERLREVISGWEPDGKSILTLVGSQHVNFSDFPVLPIVHKKGARKIMNTIGTLSLAFLDGKLDQCLEEEVNTVKMEINIVGVKKDGKPKRKLVGKIGDVIADY